MSIRIIPALPEHAEGTGYVHYTAWEKTYRDLMPDGFLDGRSLEKCVALSKDYPNARLVMLDGERVVGFACYYDQARDFTGRTNEASEIAALYLLRSYQGRRYGRTLMEK